MGTTYIIGHKNPDADAICSAIAYADLKKQMGFDDYIAARCGNTNARIDAILQRFQQPAPVFLGDVSPRVRDIMARDVVKIEKGATLSEALELIDKHDVRVLPVVSSENILQGYVSIFQMGDYFIPKYREPRAMRHVHTTLNQVVRALNAKVEHLSDADNLEDMYVKIGAMDIRSFGKAGNADEIDARKTIVIVGDRWDIQQRSIQIGVRLLVITGNLEVDPEVVEAAKENGVSIIISPFDSATTAWSIRTATQIDHLIENNFVSFKSSESVSHVSRRIANMSALAFMVTNEKGQLTGLFTKTDVLKPPAINLVLVDHNEVGQAVPGADDVNIVEIVDHHRLAPISTEQPILFVNEPVGSTCTIVANMFRAQRLTPSPSIAGIMMSGIISDTLNLTGPTTTDSDRQIMSWLEEVADLDAGDLANEIFSSGSVILSMDAKDVIRADQKFYEKNGVRFSVSQIEELGFNNFWKAFDKLADALENFAQDESLAFACILVTDINLHNSLLLINGDDVFIDQISYPAVERGRIYDLKGVVSRKKQLIPYLSGMLKGMKIKPTV